MHLDVYKWIWFIPGRMIDTIQGWESSGFRWNSGFLMIPQGHSWDSSKFAEKLCVCVHYKHEFLTPCAPAMIMSIWKLPCVVRIGAFCGGLQVRLSHAKIGWRRFVMWFVQDVHSAAQENSFALWEVRHAVLGLRVYIGNMTSGSNNVAMSVFTPEAISGKTFRRFTKEKATIAKQIDKWKNCLNFAWLEENVSLLVYWEGKPKNSQSVSVIAWTLREIDLLWKTYCIRSVTVPIWSVAVHLARRGSQHCVVYQLPPASNIGVLCCTATRTVLSVLSYRYTVQPLGPPSVNYLRHSADLP